MSLSVKCYEFQLRISSGPKTLLFTQFQIQGFPVFLSQITL